MAGIDRFKTSNRAQRGEGNAALPRWSLRAGWSLGSWNRRTFRFSSTKCGRSCNRSAAASSSIARSASAGHSRMLLEGGATRLIGIDRDTDALAIAREALGEFGDRVTLVHADYREIAAVLDAHGRR